MRVSLKQNKLFIILAMSLVLGVSHTFLIPLAVNCVIGSIMKPAGSGFLPVEIMFSLMFLVIAFICILLLVVCLAYDCAAFAYSSDKCGSISLNSSTDKNNSLVKINFRASKILSKFLKIISAYCGAVLVLSFISGLMAAFLYRMLHESVTVDVIKEFSDYIITAVTLAVMPLPTAAFWRVMYGKDEMVNNNNRNLKSLFKGININFRVYIKLLILFLILYVLGYIVTTAVHSNSELAPSYMSELLASQSGLYIQSRHISASKILVLDIIKTAAYTASGMAGIIITERICMCDEEDFINVFKSGAKGNRGLIFMVLCAFMTSFLMLPGNIKVCKADEIYNKDADIQILSFCNKAEEYNVYNTVRSNRYDDRYAELEKQMFCYGAGQGIVKLLSWGNVSGAAYMSDYLYHAWDLCVLY